MYLFISVMIYSNILANVKDHLTDGLSLDLPDLEQGYT